MGRLSWLRRSSGLRRAAHGLLAGALLSCLRAPLGLDWTQLAAVQGSTAALFRAAGLLALVLALDPARAALRLGLGAGWLAALCAGFALHGLVLDVTPESRAGYVLTLLAGTLLLRTLAGARTPPGADAGDGAMNGALGRGERLGLVLVGFGSTLALETLAHEVRLFTGGTRADDTAVATVFLVLVMLGAVAFAPLARRLGDERTRAAAGLALAGGASLAGLYFLAQLTPDGLHGYLRRLDASLGPLRALDGKLGGTLGLAELPALDGASIGTLWTTAVLAAAALVAPGFLLGATLGSLRHPGRVAHAACGAAFGLVVLPAAIRAVCRPLRPEELGHAAFAWTLVAAGAAVAGAGVACLTAGTARQKGTVLGLALVVALVPWLRPRLVVWSFSPWSPAVIVPDLVWPTPEGLLTVERARGAGSVVTLDRRRLTPIAEEEAADERRLRLAWALLPHERRAAPVRALFVGQLTPARARVLRSLGTLELERTAPWHAAMPAVDEHLFGADAADLARGRIVTPAEARSRIAAGEYDWVVAPPIRGPIVSWKTEARAIWGSVDAPDMTALELPDRTAGVAWIPSDSLARRGARFEPLLVDAERLESLALGLVRGAQRGTTIDVGPLMAVPDLPAPRPLEFLRTMPQQRKFVLERAWSANLVAESAPELARGLALHFAAQTLSSPYETRAQQIELEEEPLRAFLAAAPPLGALDALSRDLWESVAWILTEKRLPDMALVFLEPVAQRFAPWAELDRALGRAYREVLEPEMALTYLERASLVLPDDVDLLVESAACAAELGDGRAVGYLERALALQPGRKDLERALGLALIQSGDDRGRALLERHLREHPDDAELLEALGRAPEGTSEPH